MYEGIALALISFGYLILNIRKFTSTVSQEEEKRHALFWGIASLVLLTISMFIIYHTLTV